MRYFFSVKRRLITVIALLVLSAMTLGFTISSSRAQRTEFETPRASDVKQLAQLLNEPSTQNQSRPTDCAIQPGKQKSTRPSGSTKALGSPDNPVTLLRFRNGLQFTSLADESTKGVPRVSSGYTPAEEIVLIDPTNYGDRYLKDISGKPANLSPIIVLHETVSSVNSTLNFFRTPHPRDSDQASYHTLISLDGTVIYLVPPDKRAYGAGNSVFLGVNGPETVKTHAKFPPSVNNFAYHISLETPPDGYSNVASHSGYTDAQYQSLAWLVAKTGIADNRITTHQAVDRSNSRMDPRSFSFPKFFRLLQTYTKTNEIIARCTIPPGAMQTKKPLQKATTQAAK